MLLRVLETGKIRDALKENWNLLL